MQQPPILEAVAGWAAELQVEGVPERIWEHLGAQVLSVAAATLSGRATREGRAALAVSKRVSGARRLPVAGGGKAGLLEALELHATWSMVQDYDDYLVMGHTGHSAVWVPLLVGAWLDAPAEEVWLAAVIANEVAGRLGASLLLGPHNGQMWAPIHRLAAAAATGRLLGMTPERLLDALALALYDAEDPVFAGFMGPDSKVRTAADAIGGGVRAALLAAEGLRGEPRILEHPRGFWGRFAFVPLRGTFRGLGTSWVTDSLTIKPWPGCAYVDTVLAALERIQAEHQERYGEPLTGFRIDRIEVAAGVLTVGMDALSREAVAAGRLSPVVVNFSVPLTVAAQILFGRLTGENLTDERLEAHREELGEIAERVHLVHDTGMSAQLLDTLAEMLPLEHWLESLTLGDLRHAWRRAREELGDDVRRAVLHGPLRRADRATRRHVRRLLLPPLLRKLFDPFYGFPPRDLPFEAAHFQRLRWRFPAEVRIRLREGDELRARVDQPPGMAAAGEAWLVAEAKWRREGARFLGGRQVEALVAAVRRVPRVGPGELLELLA